MLNDKRVRYLVIAVLVVILALGVLSLLSTLFQMIVPLAIVIGGAFAFYKLAIQGRDSAAEQPAIEADEAAADIDAEADEASQRLSAVEEARRDFLETPTLAEEILADIESRRGSQQQDDET